MKFILNHFTKFNNVPLKWGLMIKFENLNNMGIHSTDLKPGVQNNLFLFPGGTLLNIVKNVFNKLVLVFLVEYSFAPVKLIQKNCTPLLRITSLKS